MKVIALSAFLVVLCLLSALPASAQFSTLYSRFAPPAGTQRVLAADGSFGGWLRQLPLYPVGTQVHLYNGRLKDRQDVHAAVVALSVGKKNLQQCADAVMRLRAEYLKQNKQPVGFLLASGKWSYYTNAAQPWQAYLDNVFAWANTESLERQLHPVAGFDLVQPGDVLIVGGAPGHAVLVLDVAVRPNGQRYALLGQSFMPAQQFHVLRNLTDPSLGAWFELTAGVDLETPEYDFPSDALRRF